MSKVALKGLGVLAFALFVEFLAGLYLMLFDKYLYTFARYHWDGMVMYTIVNLVLFAGILKTGKRSLIRFSTVWSFLGVLGMILDALLGLPFSYFSNPNGISYKAISSGVGYKYLFGFGSGFSVLYTSIAFTVLLLFSIVTLVSSIRAAAKPEAAK